METTIEALAEQLQGEIRGNRNLVIHGAQAIGKAGPHEITYVLKESNVHDLQESRAGAVVVAKQLADSVSATKSTQAAIVVDDAQDAFIQLVNRFQPERARPTFGVSPGAVVDPSASIGANTNVYPGATIGEAVVIGDECDIYPGVYIGPSCQLGDQVTLYPNAVLYADVEIGDRVTIHASAIIGADGFGYRFEEGRYIKIPQVGAVRIEDDCEIGACTTIDRGMIAPTVVGKGTKLDNLVMIAHNCELGRHNALASQVGFAGSITTGDYVRCAGQVGVADHLHLGEGSTLAAKAAVHKDVPAGETHIGYPAGPVEIQKQILMGQFRLPKMRKQLLSLQNQIAELTAKLEELTGNNTER